MALTDIVIVVLVFLILGYMILVKIRSKDPKKYDNMFGWLKKKKEEPRNTETPQNEVRVLPSNARIM